MSNIPLYIYIHHIFFSNSFVDGYFHVLTVVNSAAMNTRVHVSFWIMFSFPLDIYTGVELQGHMVALPLVFQGTAILFSIVAVSISISTKSVGGFPSLRNLCSIFCLWIF